MILQTPCFVYFILKHYSWTAFIVISITVISIICYIMRNFDVSKYTETIAVFRTKFENRYVAKTLKELRNFLAVEKFIVSEIAIIVGKIFNINPECGKAIWYSTCCNGKLKSMSDDRTIEKLLKYEKECPKGMVIDWVKYHNECGDYLQDALHTHFLNIKFENLDELYNFAMIDENKRFFNMTFLLQCMQKHYNVSFICAQSIWYVSNRPRGTDEHIERLVKADKVTEFDWDSVMRGEEDQELKKHDL